MCPGIKLLISPARYIIVFQVQEGYLWIFKIYCCFIIILWDSGMKYSIWIILSSMLNLTLSLRKVYDFFVNLKVLCISKCILVPFF